MNLEYFYINIYILSYIWTWIPVLMLSVDEPDSACAVCLGCAQTFGHGAEEGGARAASVKQTVARRQISNMMSSLITTVSASSSICRWSQPGSSTHPPALSPADAGRSVSQAQSAIPPLYILPDTLSLWDWAESPWLLARVIIHCVSPRARACSWACTWAQRVIWCREAESTVWQRQTTFTFSCKHHAPTSFIRSPMSSCRVLMFSYSPV